MEELKILKRRIQLKKQAIFLIRDETIDLQIRAILILFKSRLENKMGSAFDPNLSKKIDCLTFLLEN